MTNLDSLLKSRDITLLTKVCVSQRYGFSGSHVWMWELNHKEVWTVVLEKTLKSLLNSKEIKPVHPKGSQPWIFLVRTGAEAKAPGLWPIDVKSWKRPWCWNRLRARGEASNRGWDGWRASLSQWTWVWANSGKQWRTGNPGILQLMGLKRVRHDWVTEQQQLSYWHYDGL